MTKKQREAHWEKVKMENINTEAMYIRYSAVVALVIIIGGGFLMTRSCQYDQELRLKRIEACKAIGGYMIPGSKQGDDLCIANGHGTPVPLPKP